MASCAHATDAGPSPAISPSPVNSMMRKKTALEASPRIAQRTASRSGAAERRRYRYSCAPSSVSMDAAGTIHHQGWSVSPAPSHSTIPSTIQARTMATVHRGTNRPSGYVARSSESRMKITSPRWAASHTTPTPEMTRIPIIATCGSSAREEGTRTIRAISNAASTELTPSRITCDATRKDVASIVLRS